MRETHFKWGKNLLCAKFYEINGTNGIYGIRGEKTQMQNGCASTLNFNKLARMDNCKAICLTFNILLDLILSYCTNCCTKITARP